MGRNFIVLDTEGVSDVRHRDGQVHGETSLFYDFGYIIADSEGNKLVERSFINTDVFFNQKLMDTAYYKEKLPQYFEGMNTEWQLADTLTIWRCFRNDCKQHNVKDVWAYNARYDLQSVNYTVNKFSNGFCSYFIPYGCQWRDIWDYAGSTVCATKKYVKWCAENGFISDKGNPSTSADTVAKYVYGELAFAERHTALSDCECELDILLAAKKRHQKARHSKGQGWRDSSAIAKRLRTEQNA